MRMVVPALLHLVVITFLFGTWLAVHADQAQLVELRTQAEQGDAEAQLTLGMLYYSGEGVPQHLGEAVKWLRRAADQNNAVAQSNLGVLYLKGEGVPVNGLEAFKWFTKAANQGFSHAQVYLGNLYLHGAAGVRRFPQEGVRWLRRAADQGDPQGQRFLGELYADGQVLPKDLVEAYKWFNLAAAQNDEKATDGRRAISRFLTQAQIAEAQRRALAFRPRREAEAKALARKSGTGFFVSASGYLITCYHVIEDAKRILVTSKRGPFPAQVVKTDKIQDIALLKVTGKFAALAVTNSASVRLGDSVLTLGYPNVQVQGKELKLTRGEINSIAGIKDDSRYFQISAPVQPGNSGGPLLDRFGNVIGLVTLRLDDLRVLWATGAMPQNVNYALKSSYLVDLIQSMPTVKAQMAGPLPATQPESGNVVQKVQDAVVMIQAY